MDLITAKHILGDFDDALRTMRDTVLMMASLTERLLASASESLSARSFEACERVIADDAEIDVLEKSVDEAVLLFWSGSNRWPTICVRWLPR